MDNDDDLVPQNDYENNDWQPSTDAVFRQPQPQVSGSDVYDGYDRLLAAAEFSVPSTTLTHSSGLHRPPPAANGLLLERSVDESNFITSPTRRTSASMSIGYDYSASCSGISRTISSSSRSSSLDRKESPVRLLVIRQPELQHRARYLSEGSRGAIKDRSGSSNCTIQLIGYHRPTRVQLMAVLSTDDVGSAITPHPLYRLIPVSGKTANASSCQKIVNEDGMECIEIVLYPENNMIAMLDCIGILKICTYDTKHRKRKSNGCAPNTVPNNNNGPQQHNSMRIFMRAYVPFDAHGSVRTVNAITEPISCVQQLGVPEIYKISRNCAPARGGDEIFIIGRNFDRNAKILFREYKEDGTLKWSAEARIDKQYLHQCHIVCTIPPYVNMQHGGEVSLTVICSSKSSHPRGFVYTACEEEDDWRPPGSPKLSMNTAFCLPDYEVDNHRDLTLLERNCCPSSFYDGGLSSVTVPCSKVDVFTPQRAEDSLREFSVTTALIHDADSRLIIGNDHLTGSIHHFVEDQPKAGLIIQQLQHLSGHKMNSISRYQSTAQPIHHCITQPSDSVGETSALHRSRVHEVELLHSNATPTTPTIVGDFHSHGPP